MRRTHITISDFYCPECGFKMPLARRASLQRDKGHLKWLWCPGCNKKRNFMEIRFNDAYTDGLGEVIG